MNRGSGQLKGIQGPEKVLSCVKAAGESEQWPVIQSGLNQRPRSMHIALACSGAGRFFKLRATRVVNMWARPILLTGWGLKDGSADRGTKLLIPGDQWRVTDDRPAGVKRIIFLLLVVPAARSGSCHQLSGCFLFFFFLLSFLAMMWHPNT